MFGGFKDFLNDGVIVIGVSCKGKGRFGLWFGLDSWKLLLCCWLSRACSHLFACKADEVCCMMDGGLRLCLSISYFEYSSKLKLLPSSCSLI